MTYDSMADGGLDYLPCNYAGSRLLFRGPRRDLDVAYAAVVGGSETYGRFVERPFAALLEDALGMPVVNLGAVNAGIEVIASDDGIRDCCDSAKAVIVQVTGAQNVSNRYFTVHPRRNDRFLKASPLLRTLYPEVDFTEFHFTRHLLQTLHDTDPARFAAVRQELQSAWMDRMAQFLRRLRRPAVLLWMGARRPEEPSDLSKPSDPLFVTRDMLDRLAGLAKAVVMAVPSREALAVGRCGMVYSDLEAPAAGELPNPAVHAETAEALADCMQRLVPH